MATFVFDNMSQINEMCIEMEFKNIIFSCQIYAVVLSFVQRFF